MQGYDRVGFLASLLGRLSALALDAFHLKAAGGGPPRPETARALSQALEALRQDRPGRPHPAPV